MRLGKHTLIPATDAEALIKFMEHGRVLAVATAYAGLHAELSACVLLRELPQFDSVFIVPFHQPDQEKQSKEERREARQSTKEARRAARRAYKNGNLH